MQKQKTSLLVKRTEVDVPFLLHQLVQHSPSPEG